MLHATFKVVSEHSLHAKSLLKQGRLQFLYKHIAEVKFLLLCHLISSMNSDILLLSVLNCCYILVANFNDFAGCLARKMYMVKRETAAAIIVQKYVRRWRLHRTYQQAHSAALLIQSCIRGFIARRYFSVIREQKAALVIQVCPSS